MPTTASSELTEGRSGAELDDDQPALPLELIAAWVEDQADPYAAPRMVGIKADLDDTWLSWRGEFDADGLFYFRVHGPGVWIEPDHSGGSDHLHTVWRDPVDDYGADTLVRHYAEFH